MVQDTFNIMGKLGGMDFFEKVFYMQQNGKLLASGADDKMKFLYKNEIYVEFNFTTWITQFKN